MSTLGVFPLPTYLFYLAPSIVILLMVSQGILQKNIKTKIVPSYEKNSILIRIHDSAVTETSKYFLWKKDKKIPGNVYRIIFDCDYAKRDFIFSYRWDDIVVSGKLIDGSKISFTVHVGLGNDLDSFISRNKEKLAKFISTHEKFKKENIIRMSSILQQICQETLDEYLIGKKDSEPIRFFFPPFETGIVTKLCINAAVGIDSMTTKITRKF